MSNEMLFLPRLRDNGPSPDDLPSWTRHEAGLGDLAKFSEALEIHDTVKTAEELRSIPTPWARMLLFEQAVFNANHPAHSQLLPEWRGLLGLIGLADYLGLRVEAKPVLLPSVRTARAEPTQNGRGAYAAVLERRPTEPKQTNATRGDTENVMSVLRAMAPADDAPVLWDHLALITVNDQLVGGTSARSLVYTGVRPAPHAIPFRRDGRLIDPAEYYVGLREPDVLAVLGDWIEATLGAFEVHRDAVTALMGRQPASASTIRTARADLLIAELRRWHHDIGGALDVLGRPPRRQAEFGPSPFAGVFPDGHPAAEVLGELRPLVCNVALDRNDLGFGEARICLDPGKHGLILRDGKPYSGPVRLTRGRTARIESGRPVGALAIEDLDSVSLEHFIEPTLVRVLDVSDENATVLRSGADAFLFPFAPGVLEHLDERRLRGAVALRPDAAGGYELWLDVPLQDRFAVRYRAVFTPDRVTSGFSTPTLAVWPNFRAPSWDRYFYFVQRIGTEGEIDLAPVAEAPAAIHVDTDTSASWAEVRRYPATWRAEAPGFGGGLLFTRLPEQAPTLGTEWNVSVDFGSTHTRVFRAVQDEHGDDIPHPVRLTPRAVAVLGSAGKLPANFFTPLGDDPDSGRATDRRQEPPSVVRLPLGRPVSSAGRGWLPCDGVIFWPSLLGNAGTTGLKADLKWHEREVDDLPAFKAYINQLYLCVAAEAAAAGARIRTIRTAFPSIFPQHQRAAHRRIWTTLTDADGVMVLEAVTESRAVATYLQRERDGSIADNILAVDIGGTTTDLAVWKSRLLAGDSLFLAGDILSRLVARHEVARRVVSAAAARDPIRQDRDLQWAENGSAINRLLFTSLLRHVRQAHGTTQVLAQNMDTGKGGPGDWFISHAAYMYAVASFVMGMLVRRSKLRTRRFDLRFVGHGSEFLSWLDVLHDGTSRSLPRAFFLAGLGAESPANIEVNVELPDVRTVKQEVGRGLLGTLVGEVSGASREHRTFLGETLTSNGVEIGWETELTIDSLKELERPEIPIDVRSFASLERFIRAFDSDPGARLVRDVLAIREAWLNNALGSWIHDYLFGPESAWHATQQIRAADEGRRGPPADLDPRLRIEPFFVLEAKALLEYVTENSRLLRR